MIVKSVKIQPIDDLGLEFEIKTNQGEWCWACEVPRQMVPNRVVKKNEAVGFFVRAFALAR
ncbi:MAG TPA: hypothetical protein [Caudoviricetes sp.]|nr:MAG TPA: hypothetical protein [Caudoviricetes sp.]